MGLSARLLPLALILATPACISSSIGLHVNAGGTGKVVVTSRVSLSGIQALDSVFPATAPKTPPKLEERLRAASPGAATGAVGMPVCLTSSILRADADVGVRTTVVESKGLAFRFTAEPDQPVLRTTAPKLSDRRLGDLPGASIPVDREVFLEYEIPQQSAPPPVQSASPAQAPPDTEIYLAPLRIAGGAVTIGESQNITNNPGYDNQPFFTPDGRSILFTSIRGGGTQSDIYRYNVITAETTQVTNTPESEYSPTMTPSGALSVVRVELDGQNTQRLWQFTADGRDPKVLLPDVKPVGYHAWADDHTVALFILGSNGAPATLQLADTRTGAAVTLATDIGRSIQAIPGTGATHTISFVQRERAGGKTSLVIKELDPASRAITVLTPAVEGSTEADLAWAPDGTLLMANAGKLYTWRRGQSGWKEVASLEQQGLRNVTRLAVSPRGSSIAIVAAPPATR